MIALWREEGSFPQDMSFQILSSFSKLLPAELAFALPMETQYRENPSSLRIRRIHRVLEFKEFMEFMESIESNERFR